MRVRDGCAGVFFYYLKLIAAMTVSMTCVCSNFGNSGAFNFQWASGQSVCRAQKATAVSWPTTTVVAVEQRYCRYKHKHEHKVLGKADGRFWVSWVKGADRSVQEQHSSTMMERVWFNHKTLGILFSMHFYFILRRYFCTSTSITVGLLVLSNKYFFITF